jgi:hypothetical protein
MPYVDETSRNKLDDCIGELILCLKNTASDKPFEKNELDNNEILSIAGNINYVFSRVCANLMGTPSYSKIVVLTGVLENIKQEFYRRVASSYEDKKIAANGDIKEYKKLN